ncbi:hypothetical protein F5Y18DRAFT_423020 [Xylariaceae sp. FL1019]|nr:hypothetical protein F5Y18DRAFT_423020 [Xylariaceae sp. FL1019]
MPPSEPPEPPARIPLSFWLMTGGRGPPPTLPGYRRMALERKAAYREEQAHKLGKQASSKAHEEKYGPSGLKALVQKIRGKGKREKPKRKELMEKHGRPEGASESEPEFESESGEDETKGLTEGKGKRKEERKEEQEENEEVTVKQENTDNEHVDNQSNAEGSVAPEPEIEEAE